MQILQGTLEFAVSFRWGRICLYTREQIATVFLDDAPKDLRWNILEEKVPKKDLFHDYRFVNFFERNISPSFGRRPKLFESLG
jgi:hypothetical protein